MVEKMSAEQMSAPSHFDRRHIFVSSVEQDRLITDAVVQDLEAGSFRCWIAHRDIVAGMSWMGAIVNAIVESRLMVVIVSKHSVNSPHVLREVTIADDERVPFLPFCIDSSTLSPDLRYFFSTAQRLDASNLPEKDAIDLLRKSVANRFGSTT